MLAALGVARDLDPDRRALDRRLLAEIKDAETGHAKIDPRHAARGFHAEHAPVMNLADARRVVSFAEGFDRRAILDQQRQTGGAALGYQDLGGDGSTCA